MPSHFSPTRAGPGPLQFTSPSKPQFNAGLSAHSPRRFSGIGLNFSVSTAAGAPSQPAFSLNSSVSAVHFGTNKQQLPCHPPPQHPPTNGINSHYGPGRPSLATSCDQSTSIGADGETNSPSVELGGTLRRVSGVGLQQVPPQQPVHPGLLGSQLGSTVGGFTSPRISPQLGIGLNGSCVSIGASSQVRQRN